MDFTVTDEMAALLGTVRRFIATELAPLRTSILQSLERGSPTDVRFVDGAEVQRGRARGAHTPVNATLEACVEGLELAAP